MLVWLVELKMISCGRSTGRTKFCVVLVVLAVRLFQQQRGYDMKLSCCVVFVLCVSVAVSKLA